jgi:hypothetical protein
VTAKPIPRCTASPCPACAGTPAPATTSPAAPPKAKPAAKPSAASSVTSPARSIRSSRPHPKPSRQQLDIHRGISPLEAARARGRTGGRKPKLTDRQIRIARQMYDEEGPDRKRKYTVAEIAETFHVSRKTTPPPRTHPDDTSSPTRSPAASLARVLPGTIDNDRPAP